MSLDEASAQSFKATLGQHEQGGEPVLSVDRSRGSRSPRSETLWALTILIFVWLGRRKLGREELKRSRSLMLP